MLFDLRNVGSLNEMVLLDKVNLISECRYTNKKIYSNKLW